MAEDLSAKIGYEWEKLQLTALRFANAELNHNDPSVKPRTTEAVRQIVCAVISTFTPEPLGVDDFIGALAVANANAGEDADASPPVFAGKG